MKIKRICILGLSLLFPIQSFSQAGETANITIDASVETDTLIPGHTFTALMFPTDENRLSELGITHCREFSFSVGGINILDPGGFHEIFPIDGDPDADPSDLTNWDTQIFCDIIEELIVAGNLKGNLTCGLWNPILNVDGEKAALPHDWNEYEIWVQNIVRHLTEGLPLDHPGHYWADHIYAWSFWNEPLGAWWEPEFFTVDELQQIFTVWSKAIKEINPNFLILSPEWEAYGFDGIQHWALYDSIFTQFYTYVRDNNGYVDFIEQHGYSWNPYTRKYVNDRLNLLIDNLGLVSNIFGKPKLSDTESFPFLSDCTNCSTYSYVPYSHYDSSWASSWIISQACYGIGSGTQYWSLFTGDGNQSEYIHLYTDVGEKKPSWYAVKALTWLKDMKYVVEATGSDLFGFSALGTKSEAGDSLIIFISNYDYKYAIDTMLPNVPPEVPQWLQEHLVESNIAQYNFIRDSLNNGQEQVFYDSYNLSVTLPPISEYPFKYERYIIDDTYGLGLIDSSTVSSDTLHLQNIAIPRFQSQVIKFYRQTGVGIEGPSDLALPIQFNLLQNYPNPFNPVTTIEYQIPHSNHVKLIIYNVLGQEVKSLVDQNQVAGNYSIVWDGKDNWGKNVTGGIYFYRLITKTVKSEIIQQTKKFIFLR